MIAPVAGATRPSGGGGTTGALALLVGWSIRLLVLLLLLERLYSQWEEFRSQPVSSDIRRRQAPFPRLTLCPGATLRDTEIRHDAQVLLTNGNVSVEEFYNLTTLEMLEAKPENMANRANNVMISSGKPVEGVIPGRGPLGEWRAKYYLTQSQISGRPFVHPTRCLTLEPSEYLKARGRNQLELDLRLLTAPAFTNNRDIAYRLFFHGDEEPNVGDLAVPEVGAHVPHTVFRELRAGSALSLRLTARMRHLVSRRRDPCREDPGYSLTQCLKECLWRRLASNITCRLPHMVGNDVYLPELTGPLDHLPLCARPVQMVSFSKSTSSCRKYPPCSKMLEPWYRPVSSEKPASAALSAKLTHASNTTPSSSAAMNTRAKENRTNRLNKRQHVKKTSSRLIFLKFCTAPIGAQKFVDDDLLTDLRGCDCVPACHQTLYDLFEIGIRPEDESFSRTSPCETRLTLTVDLTADEVQEKLAFTSSTFLANIGGLIGAVTGISLFTLACAAESIVQAVAQRWRQCRNRGATTPGFQTNRPWKVKPAVIQMDNSG